jgi:hypothetical protein
MSQSLQDDSPVTHPSTSVGLLASADYFAANGKSPFYWYSLLEAAEQAANGKSPFYWYSLLEAAEQVALAPTVLEAREGEVILLTLPPSSSCSQAAIGWTHKACLRELVDTALIISFAPLEGMTSATGDYAYVVLRPRSSAASAGGSPEVGCAPTD